MGVTFIHMRFFMLKLSFLRALMTIVLSLFCISNAQYRVELLEQNNSTTVLKMVLENYQIIESDVSGELSSFVKLKDGVYNQRKGNPNLPSVVQSIIISDTAKMAVEIISVSSEVKKVNKILPSKGSVSRKMDITSVPYEYGNVYDLDIAYPAENVTLGNPYVLRDFRANTVSFFPFSYNPKKNELEIRKEIVVKIYSTEKIGENVKIRKRKSKLDNTYNDIYKRKFINYPESRYTPVDEEGDLLIISYGEFISAVEPLAEWKNRKGIRTEIIDVADIGNSTAIKTFIENYYDSTNLKYLLLIGDYTQVPNSTSRSPQGANDPSDSKYGCIEGNDSYVEVFVGRFSGTTVAHIETQVEKVLHYERELDKSDTWLNAGLGSADQSEADDKAVIDHITKELSDFTYTTVNYYQGNYNSDTQIVGWVNDGFGVFGVSTHANETSIAGLQASSAAKMNNEGMYPYNFTLGCDPGNFTFSNSQDCLGEALLKRDNGGFIGAFMASISQPWYEPYAALREFFDIITDQYPSNKKYTYGGVAMSGCMKMIDEYSSQGPWVADTWILFGDPSLAIYTDLPEDITIVHPETVGLGVQTVTVTGTDGATVALYSKEQGIQVKGVIKGGSVDFSIDVTTLDTIYVTGTGYNYQTYEGKISIVSGPYISLTSPTGSSLFNFEDDVNVDWVIGGGANVSSVKIEYSIDNKLSWESINDNVSASLGSYNWTVPDIFGSDSCFIKVSEVGGSLEGLSGQFIIKRDPEINLSKSEVLITVNPGSIGDSDIKIENLGKGILNYEIKTAGAKELILINELFVSHSSFFDGLELWNRGAEADLTGWKVSWIDSDSSTGEYSFENGFILGEGRTVVLTDVEAGTNENTIYVGKNLLWSTDSSVEMSVSLFDANGMAVDFVKTIGSSDQAPTGTEWIGDGVACTNDRIYRNKNSDNDDATDWSHADGELSVNEINPGQTLETVIESWMTLDKYDNQISGESDDEITITFNTSDLEIGEYYDTLFITHNDENSDSLIIVPCMLNVDAVGLFDKTENATSNGFKFGPNPVQVDGGVMHFQWPQKKFTKMNIIICDNVGTTIKTVSSLESRSSYTWDLQSDKGYIVAPGGYIVIITTTLLDGTVKSYKASIGIKR